MNEQNARIALVAAGKKLLAKGLVARTWGNLSLRLDSHRMAISPSGIPYHDMTEEMIVVVDLDTGDWSGSWKPSGERKAHSEIYNRRPDVHAIIHTHQDAASACAASRIDVPSPWGRTPCAPYYLPGTTALARAAAETLAEGPAVLLANHGAFVVGAGLDEAFQRAQDLESVCAAFITTRGRNDFPASLDSPWIPRFLSPLALADGTNAFLSEAPFTLAWAVRGRPLIAVVDDFAQLVGIKLEAIADVPSRYPKKGAVLVEGRGLLTCGPDAEAVAIVVEKTARAVLAGERLGGAKALPIWEAMLMRWVYKYSYSKLSRKAIRASAAVAE